MPMGTSKIARAANRFKPNGGIYSPMLKLTAMMIPKCSALTPAASTTGSRSGVRIKIAAGGSRKLPAINYPVLTNNSVCQFGKCSATHRIDQILRNAACGHQPRIDPRAGDDDQDWRDQRVRPDNAAAEVSKIDVTVDEQRYEQ